MIQQRLDLSRDSPTPLTSHLKNSRFLRNFAKGSEIYFSIVQRKVLTPNDFPSLSALSLRLRQFERHYQRLARPFQWKFTRDHLRDLLARLEVAA